MVQKAGPVTPLPNHRKLNAQLPLEGAQLADHSEDVRSSRHTRYLLERERLAVVNAKTPVAGEQ